MGEPTWLAAGRAANQCDECGSYRSDGKPPVLHDPHCSHVDDWKDPAHWYWRDGGSL